MIAALLIGGGEVPRPMIAALLSLAIAAVAPAAPGVEVQLLSSVHPRELRLSGPQTLRLEARGEVLVADGEPAAQPLRLALGDWTLTPDRRPARRYRAALALRAGAGELQVVASMPLEEYVAAVVASETEPGTPPAALEAQAVVTRSYALAQPRRHQFAAACDLAHCQVLRGRGAAAHLRAASLAARATEGEVLRLGSGEIALTPFHAACGGQTADPQEIFPGRNLTGAGAILDPGCARPWSAAVSPQALRRAATAALGEQLRDPRALTLFRGEGGFVTRVLDRASGRSCTGEAFIRALGAEVGYGRVPSPRFALTIEAGSVRLRGAGAGHGVGLCQAGAARLARQGRGYREILARFFPAARLARAAPTPGTPDGR
jgi:stage II sporulation protein D